jgi:hypothetical protein
VLAASPAGHVRQWKEKKSVHRSVTVLAAQDAWVSTVSPEKVAEKRKKIEMMQVGKMLVVRE